MSKHETKRRGSEDVKRHKHALVEEEEQEEEKQVLLSDSFIRKALENHASNIKSPHYDKLIHEITNGDDPTDTFFTNVFSSLSQYAGLVSDHHDQFDDLLTTIFQYDWLVFAEQCTYDAYENLLASFVSSNVGFIKPVFELLVSNFLLKEGDADDEVLQQRKCDTLHRAVRRILKMNPLACGYLSKVVSELFPTSFDAKIQGHFVHQILRLADEIPALKESLLTQVIERLLNVDVELTALQDIVNPTPLIAEQVTLLADRADTLLCEVFQYVDKEMSKSRPLRLFSSKLMLQIFDKCVLRTGNAKTTQYFIFYAARKSLTMTKSFIGFLLERVKDENESIKVRRVAALFWGSFLARANYIPSSVLVASICEAWEWFKLTLLTSSSNDNKTRSRRRVSAAAADQSHVLGALLQALMYVLVYKAKKVGGNTHMQDAASWSRIKTMGVASHVPKSIAQEFLKLWDDDDNECVHDALLVALLARDVSDTSNSCTSSSSLLSKFAEFPFDPLVLEMAKQKIDPWHVAWLGGDGSNEDDHEEGEDENDDDDDVGLDSMDEDELLDASSAARAMELSNLPASLTINIARVMGMLSKVTTSQQVPHGGVIRPTSSSSTSQDLNGSMKQKPIRKISDADYLGHGVHGSW